MSKEDKNETAVPKVDTPAPWSNEQLLKMLLESQQETARSNKLLAEAIMESRKPYVDPKVLDAKRRAGEDRAREINLQMRQKAATKKICPHKRENGTWNIKWQEHSNHIIKGVCGQCFSEFDATNNADDRKLLREDLKSQKNMGRAGEHARRGVLIEA